MSDSSSSSFWHCSKGCNTLLTKASYDLHTLHTACRGQVCSVELTCEESKEWGEKKWKTLASHLSKLERNHKRKAPSRAEVKSLASQGSNPTSSNADVPVVSSANLISPFSSPPPTPPTLPPGFRTSNLDH